jgi:acyl carrier protein
MSLGPELIQFIREELAADMEPETITEDAQLIDRGIMDSMALMRLVTFIEERTGVRIPDSEVMPDNFQTVAKIEDMVGRLRSRR